MTVKHIFNFQCTWTVHGRTKVWARSCCSDAAQFCRHDWSFIQSCIYILSGIFALSSLIMVPIVLRERRRQQQESRGWALMEIFFIGAAILYLIVSFFMVLVILNRLRS